MLFPGISRRLGYLLLHSNLFLKLQQSASILLDPINLSPESGMNMGSTSADDQPCTLHGWQRVLQIRFQFYFPSWMVKFPGIQLFRYFPKKIGFRTPRVFLMGEAFFPNLIGPSRQLKQKIFSVLLEITGFPRFWIGDCISNLSPTSRSRTRIHHLMRLQFRSFVHH